MEDPQKPGGWGDSAEEAEVTLIFKEDMIGYFKTMLK
jgi:hypothetical protein